jgi:hypothetical protein
MFHTSCTNCHAQLTAVDGLMGHTMLCPACQRPFIAVAAPPPPATFEQEMPVTARVRKKGWSTGQILLAVGALLLAIVICIPLLFCLGIVNTVHRAQEVAEKQDEEFRGVIRAAFVKVGYTNVKIKTTSTHALGHQATATGYDKYGKRHSLTMIFSYVDDTLEVLKVDEDGQTKITSQAYEERVVP